MSLLRKNKLSNYRQSRSRGLNSQWRLFAVVASILFAQAAVAGSHPNMYINQAEIDAITVKVNAGIEPWASAYLDMISQANTDLNRQPPLESVTFQGRTDSQYYTESPYCGWPSPPAPANGCISGQINPDQDRGDYNAAIRLGNAVRNLGLAYAFTGEAQYAEKAIDFIRVWSIDSATRMKPTPGNRIETYVTFPGYFYGADLIWNYSGWNPDEKASFSSWVRSMGDYVRVNGEGVNNFSNWRVVMLASAGALLDEASYLDLAESEWKRLIEFQVRGSGSIVAGIMTQENGRNRGLHYSLYAINAMTQGAEILRHQKNINLYDYTYVDPEFGWYTNLELALDFITPYALDPASWINDGYKQTTPISQNDSMALFEMTYSHFQKQSYLDVINRWGRPMDEIRIMGPNTLTHGNSFELDFVPIPPTITTQPSSQSVIEGESVTFSLAAIGSATLNYQWYRNDVFITGATESSYTVEFASITDDAAEFHCEITNSLGAAVSNDAILTVILDVVAPAIEGAVVQSLNQVDILYSEAVTLDSAQAISNYQIDQGIEVLGAVLDADRKTLQLQTDNLAPDTVYTVTINNIQDISAAANEILTNSSIEIQYSPVINFNNGMLPLGWIPLTASRWSVVAENTNNILFLNTTDYPPLSGSRLGEYILTPDSYADFTLTVEAKTNEPAGNTNADYALVFGFQDENNYFYMLFNRTMTNTSLSKISNGTRDNLAIATANWLTDSEFHTVAVRRVSGEIEVRFDGNLVLQHTDSSFPIGKIGLGSFNDSSYFDDIRISSGSGAVSDLIFLDSFEQ